MILRVKAALLGIFLATSVSYCLAAETENPVPQAKKSIDAVSKPEGSKSEKPLPSATEVLERYGKAIGGKEAYARHTSQHAIGTVEMPAQGLSGKMEVFAARPNKLLMKMQLAGVGEFNSGYDGKVGWMSSALTGPMIVQGKALEQLSAQADFDQALHKPGDYTVSEVLGVENFNGEECYKVKLVHRSGYASTEYFSTETGLQRGFVTTQDSPLGPMTSTTTVVAYKHFGDLYLPSRISQKASGMETVMSISETEYDKVPDSVFDLPAEIKALQKGKSTESSTDVKKPKETRESEGKK